MTVLIPGPIVETISDFWEMVWEQKSPVIVMLTKVEEKGKVSTVCMNTTSVFGGTFEGWYIYVLTHVNKRLTPLYNVSIRVTY